MCIHNVMQWGWAATGETSRRQGTPEKEKTPAHHRGTSLARPLLQDLSCCLIKVLKKMDTV